MNLKEITIFGIFLLSSSWLMTINAQVTVGSGVSPLDGVLLDLKQNNGANKNSTKGLGLPRVKITNLYSLSPCVENPDPVDNKNHEGLTVYNVYETIEHGGEDATIITKGIYIWNGNRWEPTESSISPLGTQNIIGDIESNSFMVPTAASIRIPVKKAYTVWKNNTQLNEKIDLATLSGVRGAKLLWQDKKSLVLNAATITLEGSGEDAYINVQPNIEVSNIEGGNALIAFTIDGKVYWSWHVWFTNYNPNTYSRATSNPNTNNGLLAYANAVTNGYVIHGEPYSSAPVMHMDRNLGAADSYCDYKIGTSLYGMIYQWGRKDPLPAASTTNLNTNVHSSLYDAMDNKITIPAAGFATGVTNNLKTATQNPTTVYYNNITQDWFSDHMVNHTLWSNAATLNKTDFDPCPKGWRVTYNPSNHYTQFIVEGIYHTNWYPSSATYAGGTRSQITGSFFPAGGYMTPNLASSLLDYTAVGSTSRVWTATTSLHPSYTQYVECSVFTSAGSSILNIRKGTGASVRCIKVKILD